jgi:hypothetical protein
MHLDNVVLPCKCAANGDDVYLPEVPAAMFTKHYTSLHPMMCMSPHLSICTQVVQAEASDTGTLPGTVYCVCMQYSLQLSLSYLSCLSCQ